MRPAFFLTVLLFGTTVAGGELPSPAKFADLPSAIDHFINARLQEEGITPAPLVDDAGFLRRLALDLAGRIPTKAECDDFQSLPSDERREAVIEHFLNAPDFAFHQANEIDLMLLAKLKADKEWRTFLLEATRDNRPWSQLFAQILIPETECPGEVGPAAFLRERVRELDDMTNDTAVLFFGINISCAKCHDHPLVADWGQKHYFGMTTFFKRTYQAKSKLVAEHLEGDVKFTDLFGEDHQASFVFLSNDSIEEPPLQMDKDQRKQLNDTINQAKKDDEVAPPAVPFSPRQQLVELALLDNRENFLAENIINRTWARLLGRGMVMPLDQMHSDNPASHPELMAYLVEDLKAHGYDLKRLISGIVRSEPYARTCRWESESDPPAPDLFAVALPRPLTPRQLALSLTIAGQNPDLLPGLEKGPNWIDEREKLENQADQFASWFPIPDQNFQVGTEEALLFSNSESFDKEFLGTSRDQLLGHLTTLNSSESQIGLAFQAVLSREPNADEISLLKDYLSARQDHPEAALQQVVWALMSSPEFRFNH